MIVHIKNLHLQAIIGIHDWERKNKQDLIIDVEYQYDSSKAVQTDNINDAVDYDQLTKKIATTVENSQYFLIEKLADQILQVIMSDSKIVHSKVKVEKPHAIAETDSVSVITEKRR